MRFYTKTKHIFLFIISLWATTSWSQAQDSLYQQRYGLRLGLSASELLRTALDKNYLGVEAVADYRFLYRYYVAAEWGLKSKQTFLDTFDFSTQGTYAKVGVDYNIFNNWYGMENMIFLGGRYAVSVFSHQLNSYSITHYHNDYWQEDLQGKNPSILTTYGPRVAHWIELVVGIKVELLKNFYASADLRLKAMLYQSKTEFPNYWIPGYERVWEGGSIGVGYNYTLTYLIPFWKKSKKKSFREQPKK